MKKTVPLDAILIPPEAQRVFDGVIFDVYQWQQALYDGSTATFERIRRADTVLAICIVDDKILVIEDEQPQRGKALKFPGGRVDPEDASPLAAAQREIREETGYEFATWKLLNVVQPENKIEWFVYVYVAYDITRQQLAKSDGGERIIVQLKNLEEVKRLARTSQGMLGRSRDIFESVEGVDNLRSSAEFEGREIDR